MSIKRQSELHRNMQSVEETTTPVDRKYKDIEWFKQKYFEEGLSGSDIANLCGVHPQTVYDYVRKHGVKLRKTTHKPLSKEVTKRMGENQRGENNPNWKGGKMQHNQGYVKVLVPEHPMGDRHGYVLEHRIVMEHSIGRYLYPWEIVHHKNGIRNDNRPENLEITYKGLHHRTKILCPHCHKDIFGNE